MFGAKQPILKHFNQLVKNKAPSSSRRAGRFNFLLFPPKADPPWADIL